MNTNNKALLVIDIQKGLTNNKKLYNDIQFIDTVNFAIEKFRQSDTNMVIFVQHINKLLIEGSPDWEVDERINKKENDYVVQKRYGNAFKKTELKDILKKFQVDEIFACGLVSHGCVKATCIGGLKQGFKVSLLKNGHTNWDKNAEKKIVKVNSQLSKLGVEILDKNEAIYR